MDQATELHRRLNNLAIIGTVAEVDTQAARCRVEIGELETDWLPWLTARAGADKDWWPLSVGEQVMVLSPGGDPAQGIVLPAIYSDQKPAPDNRAHTRRITFADGTRITYDNQAKTLTAECVGKITVLAESDIAVTSNAGDITATAAQGDIQCTATTGNIQARAPAGAIDATASTATVTASTITLNGAVTINGSLTLAGPFAAGPGAGGAGGAQFQGEMAIQGAVDIQGDVDTTGTLTNNGKEVGSALKVSGVTPGSGTSGNPV